MKAEWKQTTIGALVDEGTAVIQTGPFGSQLHSHEYEPEGVPVVPTEAIGRRILRTENLPKVSPQTAARLSRHYLRAGDILFARRGIQATGLSALVQSEQEGWLCGTGAILLRSNKDKVAPEFLTFVLSTGESINWLKAHAVGAVMPNLNASVIRGLPILLPPLPEQKAIARILSSLDDKIELNRRMNATLEALAQTLFRAWFIDFEPVKARAAGLQPAAMDAETAALFPSEFEASTCGPIPKGWKWSRLDEAFDINPTRRLGQVTEATYLDMASVPTQGHRPVGWIQRKPGSGMKFQNGDTLLARITPCLENGKTAFVDFLKPGEVGWGSTEFIVLCPRSPLPKYFAYLLCRYDAFRLFAIQSMTGTSGRQRVQHSSLGQYMVPISSEAIAQKFGQIIEPLAAQIARNSEQSRTLADTRDSLLPRLISGQLRVPDVEQVLADASLGL